MLKAKRLKSMFVLYSACAVMATGFTSQAASEQPEVTTITETKGENTNTHTAVQAISQNIVASAQEMTDASQQVIADNIAKKEEEERKLRKAEFEAGEQSGIQKGIQKGIQEGIQEGKELKTKEIVNSLLQDGMGIEKIAELLKISREHVLELAGMKMSKYDGL